MKIIEVGCNYECPFHYTETYQISEYTAGSDSMCTLLREDCCGLKQKKCPLSGEDMIIDGLVCLKLI